MTIRHIVMWKLAAEDSATRATHAAQIAERLNALVGVIDDIQSLTVESNVAYPESNSDVVLVADYADLEALDRYQKHPAHVEAAAFVRSVVSGRAAIDFAL
jgi:hypothetical protein